MKKQLAALRPVAILIVGSVVMLAVPTSVVVARGLAAGERARVEAAAADALEQKFVDYYRGALDRLEPFGTQIVHDATAWSRSASLLLTDIDVSSLQSTAHAVSGVMHATVSSDATSAELEAAFDSRWAVIQGGRERMDSFTDTLLAAAKKHLDAAAIADSTSRQAVVDAMAALEASAASREGMVASLTALTAAVVAVDASQAAAEAAAAAAAAAAARKGGGGSRGPAVVRRSGEPTCSGSLLSCVNAVRAFYGLGTLSASGSLNASAQSCADILAQPGAPFQHTLPLAPGVRGENIARGYPSEVSVFNAWMGSPGHAANILRASFHSMGLGYASGNNWCQQFG